MLSLRKSDKGAFQFPYVSQKGGESWVLGGEKSGVGGTLEDFLEETIPPDFPCSFQVNYFLFPKENKGALELPYVAVIPHMLTAYHHCDKSVT